MIINNTRFYIYLNNIYYIYLNNVSKWVQKEEYMEDN